MAGNPNAIKATPARRVFVAFNYVFCIAIGIICLIPVIHILALSFSNKYEVMAGHVVLWPRGFTTENYAIVMRDAQFFRSYGVIDTTHRNETQVIPQVIRYITEHFSEPLTLEDIAAEFFVSKSYLNRHFKAYTNSTVYAYIMALRLTHARRMLREGIPAVEAGRECGFSDYSTFYKAFKTQTGLSPQQFKSRA